MAQNEFLSRKQVAVEPERQDRDPAVELLHKLVVNRKLKRSLGGMPRREFRPYILKALAKLGGSARTSDALKLVEEMVRPRLLPIDLERLPLGGDYRWRNKVHGERYSMAKKMVCFVTIRPAAFGT